MKKPLPNPHEADNHTPPVAPARLVRPSLWLLLRIWSTIGLQSFGGGSSTIFLIQREFTEKRDWLSLEEFTRLWNLCIITPGINLVSLTVLIGRKLGGGLGVIVSLVGLLLPSGLITCLLTVGFQRIQNAPAVQAMLNGIVPATGGIMFLVALNFARPLLQRGKEDGKLYLLLSLALIASATIALIVFKVTVALVLIAAALLGWGLFARVPDPVEPTKPTEPATAAEGGTPKP